MADSAEAEEAAGSLSEERRHGEEEGADAGAEAKDEGIWLQSYEIDALRATASSGSKQVRCALERVSLAADVCIEVDESGKVSIASDPPESQQRALKYLRLSRNAYQGWVAIDSSDDDGDLTYMEVPQSLHTNVYGRSGEKLALISEESKTVVFFIDDSPPKAAAPEAPAVAAAPPAPPKPSVEWLAVGKRVEVKKLGDIRSERWQLGTVREVLRSGGVMVRLDSGQEQHTNEDSTRPWYESGDAVEYHDGDGDWKQATFDKRDEDGNVTVSVGEELTQVQVDLANIRLFTKPSEEANDEAKEPEDAIQEEDKKEENEEPKEPAEASQDEAKKEEEEEAAEEPKEPTYRLAIFGDLEGRSEACLRIMNFVAQRRGDYYSEDGPGDITAQNWSAPEGYDWGAEPWELGQEFLAQCIGSKGSMRKKLKVATECSLEYLGSTACICGPSKKRAFCKALLETLRSAERGNVPSVSALITPVGSSTIEEYCEVLEVPQDIVPFVTGKGRVWLNKVEEDEGVITFFEDTDELQQKRREEKQWKEDADKKWKENAEWKDDKWNWTEDQGWQEGTAAAAANDEDATPAPAEAGAEEAEANAEVEAKAETEAEAEGDAAKAEVEEGADEAQGSQAGEVEEGKDVAATEEADAVEPKAEAKEPEPPALRKVLILAWAERSRKRARLRLEATVEQKQQGHYTDAYEVGICEEDGLATDVMELEQDDIRWASGKKHENRQTLQAASGCAIEYLGTKAVLVGTGAERARARQYIQWLLDQRTLPTGERSLSLSAITLEGRSDLTVLQVTTAEKQKLDGETLRTIEQSTSTFIFFREVPVAELLAAGSHIFLKRGGREIFAEVVQSADQQASGHLNVTLRLCDGEAGASIEEVESQAVVPVLIFGRDAGTTGLSGRTLAAKQIREYLDGSQTQAEEDWAWEDTAAQGPQTRGQEPSRSSWDTGSWGQQSKGKADDNAWEKKDNTWEQKAADSNSWAQSGRNDRGHQAIADSSWSQKKSYNSSSADTEALLDSWVEAKRARDFKAADQIRAELREQGIEPDNARPDGKRGGGGGGNAWGGAGMGGGWGGHDRQGGARDRYSDEHDHREEKSWGGAGISTANKDSAWGGHSSAPAAQSSDSGSWANWKPQQANRAADSSRDDWGGSGGGRDDWGGGGGRRKW